MYIIIQLIPVTAVRQQWVGTKIHQQNCLDQNIHLTLKSRRQVDLGCSLLDFHSASSRSQNHNRRRKEHIANMLCDTECGALRWQIVKWGRFTHNNSKVFTAYLACTYSSDYTRLRGGARWRGFTRTDTAQPVRRTVPTVINANIITEKVVSNRGQVLWTTWSSKKTKVFQFRYV